MRTSNERSSFPQHYTKQTGGWFNTKTTEYWIYNGTYDDWSTGKYIANVTVADAVGNTAQKTFVLNIVEAPMKKEWVKPKSGAVVGGTTDLVVRIIPPGLVNSSVRFYCDGNKIGEATKRIDYDEDGEKQEWMIKWDTKTVNDGQHNVTAKYETKTGNTRVLYMAFGAAPVRTQLANISRGTWIIAFCIAGVFGYGITKKVWRKLR